MLWSWIINILWYCGQLRMSVMSVGQRCWWRKRGQEEESWVILVLGNKSTPCFDWMGGGQLNQSRTVDMKKQKVFVWEQLLEKHNFLECMLVWWFLCFFLLSCTAFFSYYHMIDTSIWTTPPFFLSSHGEVEEWRGKEKGGDSEPVISPT